MKGYIGHRKGFSVFWDGEWKIKLKEDINLKRHSVAIRGLRRENFEIKLG